VKTYGLIFWNSIRGFRPYALLFRNPLRVTMVYWFLFCTVLSAAVATVQYVRYEKWLPLYVTEVSKNIPDFSFENGELKSSLAMPVIADKGPRPIILDPAETITKPLPAYTNGMVHIGKKRIKIWPKPDMEPGILSIDSFPSGKVDHDYLLGLGKQLGYVGAPFLFVVMTLVFFVVGLLQALFFATLVSFLEKTIKPPFTFEEMLNISVCALTPGSLIIAVYWAWNVALVPLDLIYFFVYIVFHVMGSGACRRSMMPPEPFEEE
jgi:hypothetical protein